MGDLPASLGERGRGSQRSGSERLDAAVHGPVRAFLVLWSVAHLVHAVRYADPGSLVAWAMVVSAALVLTSRSAWWVAALIVAQVASTVIELPAPANHFIIMALANVALAIGMVRGLARRSTPSAGLGSSLSTVRAIALLSYAAAALAKLNAGFFSEESCAITLLESALRVLVRGQPHLSVQMQTALPWTVAAIEVLVVVLLLFPRTRIAGVAFAATFHVAIVVSPTARGLGFTPVLLALLWLFLPDAATEHAKRRLGCVKRVVARASRDVQRLLQVLLLAAIVAVVAGHVPRMIPVGREAWPIRVVAVVAMFVLIIDACWYCWKHHRRVQVGLRVRGSGNLMVIGLLVVLAAAPYLGSRSVAVFTMYSNLQTADQQSNHFLLPRLPVEMSQDDLVTVEASSDRRLARLARGQEQITWHELRRLAAEAPEASISYVRGGERHDLDRIADDPVLASTHPLSHRLIAHRSYVPGRAPCAW